MGVRTHKHTEQRQDDATPQFPRRRRSFQRIMTIGSAADARFLVPRDRQSLSPQSQ
ncbi:hypothetical protein M406DRAFT_102743 [Cryphonectria parasitica EP155]|uniref:Uncharacterized protein n=1 Tax=Cryphonectria parasitica (strain ATCC 38755 / EP155) TaxID=660469 RepID=A0A9P5CSN6_CRYP1|nr:uncharacterized protein M406DRAFT_102743 [Cryphonectria parasitica EP155]KAF3768546.1 hypothetical protein M406DRAFT_102743 [Cryphonectria parasitica EP155]